MSACTSPPAFATSSYAPPMTTLASLVGAVILVVIAFRLGRQASVDAGHPEASSSERQRSLVALPTAAVAALLAAFGFATAAGTSSVCSAARMVVFANGQLVIALVITLFGICWLLWEHAVDESVLRNARSLTMLLSGLSPFALAFGAWNVLTEQNEQFDNRKTASIWLAAGLLVWLGILLRALVPRRWPFPGGVRTLSFCAIGVVAIGAVLMAVNTEHGIWATPTSVNVIYLGLISLVLAAAVWTLPG
jgi:hypothetical protein